MSFAHKLEYAGSDPYEPENDVLPWEIAEQLEQDETYQRLAQVRWLADELEQDLAPQRQLPAETRQGLFEAVAATEAPLHTAVTEYVEQWLRVNRSEFDDEKVDEVLATLRGDD